MIISLGLEEDNAGNACISAYLLARLSKILPEVIVSEFVLPQLRGLADHSLPGVRLCSASQFGAVARAIRNRSILREQLAPSFQDLCRDAQPAVRQACVYAFVEVVHAVGGHERPLPRGVKGEDVLADQPRGSAASSPLPPVSELEIGDEVQDRAASVTLHHTAIYSEQTLWIRADLGIGLFKSFSVDEDLLVRTAALQELGKLIWVLGPRGTPLWLVQRFCRIPALPETEFADSESQQLTWLHCAWTFPAVVRTLLLPKRGPPPDHLSQTAWDAQLEAEESRRRGPEEDDRLSPTSTDRYGDTLGSLVQAHHAEEPVLDDGGLKEMDLVDSTSEESSFPSGSGGTDAGPSSSSSSSTPSSSSSSPIASPRESAEAGKGRTGGVLVWKDVLLPCLQQLLSPGIPPAVRRSVACSFHELASALDQETCERDLLPLALRLVRDPDPHVRACFVDRQHLFLRACGPRSRLVYFRELERIADGQSFPRHNPSSTSSSWQPRLALAQQLPDLMLHCYPPLITTTRLARLVFLFSRDPVAEVRNVVAPTAALLIRRAVPLELELKELHAQLLDMVAEYRQRFSEDLQKFESEFQRDAAALPLRSTPASRNSSSSGKISPRRQQQQQRQQRQLQQTSPRNPLREEFQGEGTERGKGRGGDAGSGRASDEEEEVEEEEDGGSLGLEDRAQSQLLDSNGPSFRLGDDRKRRHLVMREPPSISDSDLQVFLYPLVVYEKQRRIRQRLREALALPRRLGTTQQQTGGEKGRRSWRLPRELWLPEEELRTVLKFPVSVLEPLLVCIVELSRAKSFRDRQQFLTICRHLVDVLPADIYEQRLIPELVRLVKDPVVNVRLQLATLAKELGRHESYIHIMPLMMLRGELVNDLDPDVAEASCVTVTEVVHKSPESAPTPWIADSTDSNGVPGLQHRSRKALAEAAAREEEGSPSWIKHHRRRLITGSTADWDRLRQRRRRDGMLQRLEKETLSSKSESSRGGAADMDSDAEEEGIRGLEKEPEQFQSTAEEGGGGGGAAVDHPEYLDYHYELDMSVSRAPDVEWTEQLSSSPVPRSFPWEAMGRVENLGTRRTVRMGLATLLQLQRRSLEEGDEEGDEGSSLAGGGGGGKGKMTTVEEVDDRMDIVEEEDGEAGSSADPSIPETMDGPPRHGGDGSSSASSAPPAGRTEDGTKNPSTGSRSGSEDSSSDDPTSSETEDTAKEDGSSSSSSSISVSSRMAIPQPFMDPVVVEEEKSEFPTSRRRSGSADLTPGHSQLSLELPLGPSSVPESLLTGMSGLDLDSSPRLEPLQPAAPVMDDIELSGEEVQAVLAWTALDESDLDSVQSDP